MEPEEETLQEYYGSTLKDLTAVRDRVLREAEDIRASCGGRERCPIEHCEARIKSPDSARAKLRRAGRPESAEEAVRFLHDVVGVRLVCTFPASVYRVAGRLAAAFEVEQVKDYIRTPKPNGYRSLHMILRVPAGAGPEAPVLRAEVQLRTIAMDCWASLEHQLRYKRGAPVAPLLVEELRRCASELASADLRMQTIQEWIDDGGAPGEEMPNDEGAIAAGRG